MFSKLDYALQLLTKPLNKQQVKFEVRYRENTIQYQIWGNWKLALMCHFNLIAIWQIYHDRATQNTQFLQIVWSRTHMLTHS